MAGQGRRPMTVRFSGLGWCWNSKREFPLPCGTSRLHDLGDRIGGEAGEFPGLQLVQPAAVDSPLAHEVLGGDRLELGEDHPAQLG